MEQAYEFDKILCGSSGFTLKVPNRGSLWITKMPENKNYSICLRGKDDNCYVKIGTVNAKDIDKIREFFGIKD